MENNISKQESQNKSKFLKVGNRAKFINDKTNVHEGWVVGLTTTFAKIYCPKRKKEDPTGDVTPETAEWYPITMRNPKGGVVFVSES